MTIGEVIKAVRVSRNMTQDELARLAQTKQPQVARWEASGSLPFSSLKRIAWALGIRVVDLIRLTNEDEMPPVPLPRVCACCQDMLRAGNAHWIGADADKEHGPAFCWLCLNTQPERCRKLAEEGTKNGP